MVPHFRGSSVINISMSHPGRPQLAATKAASWHYPHDPENDLLLVKFAVPEQSLACNHWSWLLGLRAGL